MMIGMEEIVATLLKLSRVSYTPGYTAKEWRVGSVIYIANSGSGRLGLRNPAVILTKQHSS